MKAGIIIFIVGFAALAVADPDHHPGHHSGNAESSNGPALYDVCFRASSDTCEELKMKAKSILIKLKERKRSGILTKPAEVMVAPSESETNNAEENLPIYITELQNLFNLSAQTDCHFEICKCKNSQLHCSSFLSILKKPLEHTQLPECLNESEKAKAILAEFKEAIKAEDRLAIVNILGKLREAIVHKLVSGDDESNKKFIGCIKGTVKEIKGAMKYKLSKLNIQRNCEFCGADSSGVDANKVRQLDISAPAPSPIMVPPPPPALQ